MAGDLDKINEIFKSLDENAEKKQASEELKPIEAKRPAVKPVKDDAGKEKSGSYKLVDKLLIDENKDKDAADETSERDYRPIRQSHEYRTGCLGGIMYFVFVVCISVVLACLAWMAASDMLALNKDVFTATVSLPSSIFSSETVDVLDEDGKVTGTERITRADMSYVSQKLKEEGLIEYKWLFEAFCKISKADTKVRPGDYELKSVYDYRALIQNLRPGSAAAVTIDVTIPEGYSMHQIFKTLEENEVSTYDELMEAAASYKFNYSFLDGLEEGDASRLEGFLFPDTYQFYVGMQASSAINKFLETFHYKLTADMLKQAENRNMSMRDVIIVASMIEKEAATDAERANIASVIYNRLNAGMPLGIDATSLYLHPEHEAAPTAEMLAEETPYNTRVYAGLPPTPISNPGIASINAALNPADTGYYYYALDVEANEHRFFTNAGEHEAFAATQNYE